MMSRRGMVRPFGEREKKTEKTRVPGEPRRAGWCSCREQQFRFIERPALKLLARAKPD